MSGLDLSTRTARTSLRVRLFLAVLVWTALGIGAIWFSATRIFAAHVEEHFNDELVVHVHELARLTRLGTDGRPELIRPLSDPRYEMPLSGYYWQVSVDGVPPLKSASLTRGSLDPTVAHTRAIKSAVGPGPTGPAILYGMVRRDPGGAELHFVISTDRSEFDRLVGQFTRQLTFWLALLAAGLMAAGVAMARITLRPLARLGEAIARLHQGRTEQLEGDYPREISPLINDLNAFVRVNAETVARSRVQAGNLAHSLRTPLAVITDEAERLAHDDATRTSAKVLLDQARTMQLQIDYQLARARSSSTSGLPGSVSILPDMLPEVLQAIGRLHRDKSFRLVSGLSESLAVPIDRVDLLELLSILLDNAGKWAKTEIVVTLDESPKAIDIVISDDGPGMSEEQIGQAFEVGVRFDDSTPGSGLGLAIAKTICEGMGADLVLHPRGGEQTGLSAHVRLPRTGHASR